MDDPYVLPTVGRPARGTLFSPDTATRPLGTIRLKKGRGILRLSALDIPGQSVMDLRLVTLTLKSP